VVFDQVSEKESSASNEPFTFVQGKLREARGKLLATLARGLWPRKGTKVLIYAGEPGVSCAILIAAGFVNDIINLSISMKIYFAGSIRGGRDDADLYFKIIEHLKRYGEVLTEHVGDKNLKLQGEDGLTNEYIHNRDLEWVLEAAVLVAEVSTASLGVGYEIGRAIENGKRVLCLHRCQDGKRLSAMIAGSPDVTNAEYRNIDEAIEIIDDFLK